MWTMKETGMEQYYSSGIIDIRYWGSEGELPWLEMACEL